MRERRARTSTRYTRTHMQLKSKSTECTMCGICHVRVHTREKRRRRETLSWMVLMWFTVQNQQKCVRKEIFRTILLRRLCDTWSSTPDFSLIYDKSLFGQSKEQGSAAQPFDKKMITQSAPDRNVTASSHFVASHFATARPPQQATTKEPVVVTHLLTATLPHYARHKARRAYLIWCQ